MATNDTIPSGLPVPNSTVPFWRTQLHEIDEHRSTEDIPSECDVLIIGAGYCGASTAYHLINDNPSPPSMVILEARQACSGATARNGKITYACFKRLESEPNSQAVISGQLQSRSLRLKITVSMLRLRLHSLKCLISRLSRTWLRRRRLTAISPSQKLGMWSVGSKMRSYLSRFKNFALPSRRLALISTRISSTLMAVRRQRYGNMSRMLSRIC